jgi:hypothetical protein
LAGSRSFPRQNQVLAIELYGNGVIVHHCPELPTVEARNSELVPGILLTDDLGTKFEWRGGIGRSEPMSYRVDEFYPAIPEDARRLILRMASGESVFDLERS